MGCRNGQVRLFNDTTLLDIIECGVPITGLVFNHVWRGAYVLGKPQLVAKETQFVLPVVLWKLLRGKQ